MALALAALAKKLIEPTGLVTDSPALAALPLAEPAQFVLGGHELRKTDWLESVDALRRDAGLFDERTVRACRPALKNWSENLRPGIATNVGPEVAKMATWQRGGKPASLTAVIKGIADDIELFRNRHKLSRVIVVNLASTEAPFELNNSHQSWGNLRRELGRRESGVLPASSLYALAAIEKGCAYVNFTPSLGATVPAIRERAAETGAVIAGDDGKTGETLIKTALAPMFAARNLRLLSWTGHNVLGNRDGQILTDAGARSSKIRSKDQVLEHILGYKPDSKVSIEFVRSLDDWKTAWDFIHFEGLFGTKMTLQFTWQGCDSILAAPLVIDLARLAAFHQETGGVGVMPHLACFFKRPVGTDEQHFFKQYAMLLDYAASHGAGRPAQNSPESTALEA